MLTNKVASLLFFFKKNRGNLFENMPRTLIKMICDIDENKEAKELLNLVVERKWDKAIDMISLNPLLINEYAYFKNIEGVQIRTTPLNEFRKFLLEQNKSRLTVLDLCKVAGKDLDVQNRFGY